MAEACSVKSSASDRRHHCVDCKQILREAVQLRCGCRVCKRCGDSNITDAGLLCPGCKKYSKKDRKNNYYNVDWNIRKEIEKAYNSHTGRCSILGKPKNGSAYVPRGKGQRKESDISPVRNGKSMASKEPQIYQESVIILAEGKKGSKVPEKVPIHQEQLYLMRCGECYSEIFGKDLHEHRRSCWKLHLYNGKSFWSYADDVQQSSARQTTNRPRVARTVDDIMDGFSQLRKIYNSLEYQVMKLRPDVRRRFTCPDSIDDPIYMTMKWKVENITSRILERCNLLSRAFQSSPNEYNMQLKLELYGNAFRVQLILLPGNNDDNLQWPFRKRVIISVLSQRSVDVYEVPPIEPNVQRCRDSCGIVVCSMTSSVYLREYIIDNCMFINCTVI